VWTKVAVWSGGVVLAVPTLGVSLGVAAGINLGDVAIKHHNGKFIGYSLLGE